MNIAIISKIAVIALIALSALVTVATVGEPRKPVTGGVAAVAVAFDSILIAAVWLNWET